MQASSLRPESLSLLRNLGTVGVLEGHRKLGRRDCHDGCARKVRSAFVTIFLRTFQMLWNNSVAFLDDNFCCFSHNCFVDYSLLSPNYFPERHGAAHLQVFPILSVLCMIPFSGTQLFHFETACMRTVLLILAFHSRFHISALAYLAVAVTPLRKAGFCWVRMRRLHLHCKIWRLFVVVAVQFLII